MSELQIAAWAAFFEANLEEALEAKAELQAARGIGREKQLGLSVALTPAEYRCEHYGDYRYCPWCGGESQAERLQRKLTGGTGERAAEADFGVALMEREEMIEILEELILDEGTNATAKCTAIRTLLELKRGEQPKPAEGFEALYEARPRSFADLDEARQRRGGRRVPSRVWKT